MILCEQHKKNTMPIASGIQTKEMVNQSSDSIWQMLL